ncbi:hypothetical protein F0344_25890 [Streptomyces finlayi]|uniref:Uncharacterized protein n=1 Tax=Streptomyces finlayi TaxID=67296 RepID=A0A7G7BQF1_9ACTN|nr:hypothetical protein [Streptomyces finlayi]QNE77566.1 hypothetical protein F0344_25890 [Streptomyces finlayi]
MPLTPHAAPDAPPPVAVEVMLLRHDPTEGFAYRRLITALDRGASPDGTARRLALLAEHDELHMAHSTSWRATRDGGIVLTYLVHPDPAADRPGIPLPDPHAIARSPRPGHPTPPDLEIGHVVAHAVRHLAFLEGTDPAVAAHLATRPDLVHALRCLPGATAGEVQYA